MLDYREVAGLEPRKKRVESDLGTTAGLIQFGQERGVELKEPERRKGFLGGLQRFAEAISIGEFAVGGILSGKGIQAGIREKISPSDVLLGENDPNATRASRIVRGALGLAIDVAFDPTTYLTLGAGSALKVTTKAGVKVFLSKTGKGMLKELAQEVSVKAARQKVAEMAIMKGNEKLLKKTGLKYMGFEIVSPEKLKAPFKFIEEALNATKVGREFVGSLEKTGKSVAKLFGRDYGLDDVDRKIKQRLLDGIEEVRIDTADWVKKTFGGASPKQREAIAFAIEGGEEAIKRLDKPMQPLARRTKQIFAKLHKEEEYLGLMNHWQRDYVTHLYKNREKARALFTDLTLSESKLTGNLRFARARRIPTLKEAKKLGLDPITDIGVILNVRMVASEKARLMQKFFYETVEAKGIKGVAEAMRGGVKAIPTELQPLAKEARKFKSVEEFVEAQTKVFRGGDTGIDATRGAGRGTSVSTKEVAEKFVAPGKGVVGDAFIPSNAKILKDSQIPKNLKTAYLSEAEKLAKPLDLSDAQFKGLRKSVLSKQQEIVEYARKNNFDGVEFLFEKEIRIIKPNVLKTKSQLTDFYTQGAKAMQGGAKAAPKTLPRNILELGEGYEKLSKFAYGVPDELRNVLIPKHIGDDILKTNKRLFNDPDLHILLRGFDKAQNFFKGSVTVMFPAFHGRNFISNVLQNFLDIGAQAINPVRHIEAVKVMKNSVGDLTTDLGEKFTYKKVRALSKKNGVLTNKVTRVDIQRLLTENPLRRATPFDVGRRLGRGIENEARMVNFITNLRRGFSPEDAAAKTKEFLFDYGNLTMFEKDVCRRLIPFYTWNRKNIALQLKAAATAPGKQIAQFKALRAMEEMFGEPKNEEEKKFAPDFVMAGMNVLLNRKDDDRSFLAGFDLPIESAFDFLNKPLREVMISLSPFLKAPLEFASEFNFFKEKPIKEDDSGKTFEFVPQFLKDWVEYTEKEVTSKGKTFKIQKVNPQKKWWLQQIETFAGVGRIHSQGFIEPIASGYKMLVGEKITAEDKWNFIRFFTGLRAFTIDIEASKRAMEKNDVRELLDILERNGKLGLMEIAFPSKETAPPRGPFRKVEY
ncbi:MAG: hypothetical protein P9M03_10735 [Candidatus Theseobacter exili]|nr:hypothetical protein [Candidatus Theseobacter exili]